ncbi:MAG: hypothetical protein JNN29_04380 [Chitinophagaceae bacterium]|nr:hypothetical protein [Chitinophagaceae bacterium]MBN8667911.1 hypothetical protein [Chitinophagales bacterium]
MKKTFLAILIFASIGLVSCFDVFNDVTIKEDGSGVMSTKVDMSAMMGMLAGMGGMGEEKVKMDTSFVLGMMVDSVENLTKEEKDLFRQASVSMNMDSEEGAMVVNLDIPFKKMEDLAQIRDIMKKADFMGKSLSKLGGKTGGEDTEEAGDPIPGLTVGGKEPGIPSPDDYFEYSYAKGKISRKQISEKIGALANDEVLSKMKEMIEQGVPAMRTVYTIHLPRPVKKAEGKNVVVSDDKKTVTVENTLDELFDDPSKFEFEIEF